jgi:hypothetical protein
MKAAILSVVLLGASGPQAAVANEANSTQCDLVLAIWTQFWNEAPRRSYLMNPGTAELMSCAWNAHSNELVPGFFSPATFSDRGNTASIRMFRDYGAHSEFHLCVVERTGDYWRLRECQTYAIADMFD